VEQHVASFFCIEVLCYIRTFNCRMINTKTEVNTKLIDM